MTDKENTIGVNNPHDKVFRENYGDPDNARSLITNALPERVLKLMDLSNVGSDPVKLLINVGSDPVKLLISYIILSKIWVKKGLECTF